MEIKSNILDPIHEALDPSVWDSPMSPSPSLQLRHKNWIVKTVIDAFNAHGYDIQNWSSLYLTGSICTYQYSEDSDLDVSIFVNSEIFPEWSRAEMIGIAVQYLDGSIAPGTTHPLQVFVVPEGISPKDIYKRGLRSAYDIESDRWVIPPDRNMARDPEVEYNHAYTYALEQADKMERLLRYEPDKAEMFWHQIHKRRRADHKAGKGDFAPSNLVYKMLSNRGLLDQISDYTGEYIAKSASNWRLGDCAAFALAAHELTGWPIFKIDEGPDSVAWHFMVQTPEGDYFDGSGIRSGDEILGEHYEAADELGKYPNIYPSSATEVIEYTDNVVEKSEEAKPVVQRMLRSSSKRFSVPVSDEWFDNRFSEDQPIQDQSLYHGTDFGHLRQILTSGIIPWDQNGDQSNYKSWDKPRPGHVYLSQIIEGAYRSSTNHTSQVILQIDPKYLNPQQINPDEDSLRGWISNDLCPDCGQQLHMADGEIDWDLHENCPTQLTDFGMSLGEVAEGIGFGDDPNIAEQNLDWRDKYHRYPGRDLNNQGLAYNGSIPPDAIQGAWINDGLIAQDDIPVGLDSIVLGNDENMDEFVYFPRDEFDVMFRIASELDTNESA